MNIAARTELMQVLTELSALMPYIRLGQLLGILADRADVPWTNVIGEIEDEELLPVAREFLADMRKLPPERFAEQIRFYELNDPRPVAARAS